jgi:SAM-dependent methyltransferase
MIRTSGRRPWWLSAARIWSKPTFPQRFPTSCRQAVGPAIDPNMSREPTEAPGAVQEHGGSRTLRAVELVTEANFFAEGYLLANPDVRRGLGGNAEAVHEHFNLYGRAEGRRQCTREFMRWRVDFLRRKFASFRSCLSVAPEGFPATVGSAFTDLDAYEAESANLTPPFFERELIDNPGKRYADVGAGLRETVYSNCLYVEVYPALTADLVIEPACILPFNSASLDGLGCFSVLEHVKAPWLMAQEFARVVKPGGRIFVSWPFLQHVHGFPSHYFNATRNGLKEMFESDFEIEQIYTGAWEGPDFTVWSVLNCLINSISDLEVVGELKGMSVGELAAEFPGSEKWRRIIRTLSDESISKLSCGNTLVGRRKD